MVKNVALILVAALVCAGCGKPSAEEMLKKADTSWKAGKLAEAIEEFSAVIAAHPNSLEAESATFQIAAIYNNDTREFEKAVGAYQQYLERYPEGQQAAMAMFLMGYIYHNELHNLDSAGAVFKRFLEKYPGDEMAPSAQFELDNLGKSPGELIPPPSSSPSPIATESPAKSGKKN